MSSPRNRDEDLQTSLNQAHETLDPPAPDFEQLWSRARWAAQRNRRQRRLPNPELRWIVAGTLAGALIFALVLPWFGTLLQEPQQDRSASMSEEDALLLAEDLSSWGSSLKFLDEAPGLELYDSFPRIYQVPRDLGNPLEIAPSTLDPDSRREGPSNLLSPVGLNLRSV